MMLLLLALSQEGWIPDGPAVKVDAGRVAVQSETWAFLAAPGKPEHAELAAELVIDEPARRKSWFGEHWSVWPDLAYDDGGYDAGLLLRGGYRVQLSHAHQDVALVKVPDGGYLRVAPCPVKLKQPHALRVSIQGAEIRVSVDGQERIRYVDRLRPLGPGRFGVGATGRAKASFARLSLRELPTSEAPPAAPHVPDFSRRVWLGGRAWIFDGQEPVLLLPVKERTYVNNVKLRPGWKPLLSWNSHWDVQTQGAFKDADNTMDGAVEVKGGGASIRADWTFRHVKNRFVVRSSLVAGWDERRQVYTWDIESALEVLEPFEFRYGYDFEHHTPLDPFRWQYLVVRREGGRITHRPVYPVDPGGMADVAQSGGARVWYGRHGGTDFLLAPAVEYDLPEPGKRKMNTAVCAAFYDTGVSLASEKAAAGTKVRVKYRYTGWPAEEAEALFKASTIHETPMLDPEHHYVFADEWPKLTFGLAEPMSKTWIYGRRPFMSGHNQRPTYEWAKADGLKCGPGAYGKATLPAPSPLPAGRWVVRATVKSVNAHGPGGRIELHALDKNGNVLRSDARAFGPGSFGWTKIAFASEVPGGAPALAVAFGNAGTGEVYFKDVEFAPGEGVDVLPPKEPKAEAPAGALADWRMEEGSGLHVHDYAGGPFGRLELANLGWVVDEGRPALRFGPGNPAGYPRSGSLDRGYLGTPGYQERQGVSAALAGFHGGGFELPGLTVAAWIKPEARTERNKADLAGVGARRFILGLSGGQAPYRLEARLDVNDVFTSEPLIHAGRWQRVAMTCEAVEKNWRVRLWIDGRQVQEGTSKKLPAPAQISPSCVLGTEIFYFHDCHYRGLIGRTLIFPRALGEAELKALP